MQGASVTVIVPCYNEEAGLPSLFDRLDAMHRQLPDWGFLFVDDGSSDETFTVLLEATRDRDWLGVLRHNENLGLGAALRTGFLNATAPIICTIDSDCTYPPERLPELVAKLNEGSEIVTASAWHPESSAAEGGKVRIYLSRMVSSIYKLLIGQDVYTFTCLFRAYRRETVRGIRFRANGFAAVAELMLRAMLSGSRVGEVPIPLGKRYHGESKLKIGDAIVAHLSLLTLTAFLISSRYLKRTVTTVLS